MANPRYRASINGFWCHNETWDDVFNWDGKHDEVFLSVNTKVLDANGAVLDNLNSESELMGDTWQLPGRVQAGTASDRGGIISGDRFPWAQPMVRQSGVNTTVRVPPYVIWEGELPADRMVFLTPTIWEWDPGAGAWDGWLAWQQQTDEKYGQRAKEIFGKIWPVAAPVFDAVSLGIQTFATLAGLWAPLGQSMRRPIGLQRDPANPNGSLFNPITFALNSETAEYLVTSNPQGHGNGIRELLYVDDPYLRGVYAMFVQIEKLSDGGGGQQPTTDWESLGGVFTSGPGVSSWAPGRLDVFGRGQDNALYHAGYANGWSGWESLGGELTSDPAAVSWGEGRIDVFARGNDNGLYTQSYENGWSGWGSLGGVFTSGPAVSSWAAGRLDVFGRGLDNTIYHASYENGWSGWQSRGGSATSDPAAVSWGQGRIDLFVRGADNSIYHRFYENGWSGWESLGGTFTSGPAVSSRAPGRLDVFGRGLDNTIYHASYENGWSGWQSLGGAVTSDPAAVSWGAGRIDLFARGADNAMVHKYYDGNWKP
jgi:hypothetical protein